MPSPRGYCVRRYPFERGCFPATPLAFQPSPAPSIFDPVRPADQCRASIGNTGPTPASPTTPALPIQAPESTSLATCGPSGIGLVPHANDRPASPHPPWHVTHGLAASIPPRLSTRIELASPCVTLSHGCGKKTSVNRSSAPELSTARCDLMCHVHGKIVAWKKSCENRQG